jgi:hypothetical protein
MNTRFLVLAILVLGAIAIDARSAPAPKSLPVEKKETPKTVKFAKKEQPWKDVFAWLAETTGKPVITNCYPQGDFTFEGLADKEYTIGEVMDIFNESLLSNKQSQIYLLIQRECSFLLVPADEKIDPKALQRIGPAELAHRGETELVTLVLPVTCLDPDGVAPQIRKVMGPFGDAVPIKGNGVNQLILTDTVGNLRYIRKLIEDMETNKVEPPTRGAPRSISK